MKFQINPEDIAKAHDAMADEYDQMDDLWYPWLYARIHEFIVLHLPPETTQNATALDAGCGTGLQSFLLAQAGYKTTGIDLSKELLKRAKSKIDLYDGKDFLTTPLFNSESIKLDDHHLLLRNIVNNKRGNKEVFPPEFTCADLETYDLGLQKFDIIVCCGSVMSFLNSYESFLQRVSAALTQGGLLILETEQRWNMDLIWPIIDKIVFGKLNYHQSWREMFGNLFLNPGVPVRIIYPFELKNEKLVDLPIWLFTTRELKKVFKKNSLSVVEHQGIHCLTNLIPSTVLHKPFPSPQLASLFRFLSGFDKRSGQSRPFRSLGCSVIFALRKI